MEEIIKNRIEEWTGAPYDSVTISEINKLIEEKNENELKDRFYRQLEFGTGGLRGVIGAGTNRMNIYTVGLATQGLANHIIKNGGQDKGVVIAYDSRRKSDIFSRDTAAVLAGNGIQVYLFEDITPTPLASFAIRQLGAVSGIVITASHNPPEYNGYKVYWQDGGQVISPDDKLIIDEVNKVGNIANIKKIDFENGVSQGKIKIIGREIIDSYLKELGKVVLKDESESEIKIIYSPLHGTGYKIVPEVLKHFGFKNVILEPEQARPDGNFPTVEYPNPEERDAMSRVIELAKKEEADILMATDPDADRMGVGFKGRDGDYVLINGNQIGTMLEYYLLTRLNEDGKLPVNPVIIKTIVTTDLQSEIADSFNCRSVDVLTGFKWIAAKMKEYDESGECSFVFGGEESYGYLPVNFVRDKDAVSSCYFFAEMADWLRKKNMTLQDFLDEIYSKYGLYLEGLHSLTLKGIEGSEKIKAIMEDLRKTPPASFAGIDVLKVADMSSLKTIDVKSSEEKPITDLPSSNVLQFFLSDGSKITMRPSGTEPKIKFYFSVKEKVSKDTLKQGKVKAETKIECLKKALLKIIE